VDRCRANTRPAPIINNAARALPAAGWTKTQTVATRTGPTRNASSFANDSRANAAGNAGLPSSNADQRAADSAPICGIDEPARIPAETISHSGRLLTTAVSNNATATPWASRHRGSTRVWPKRSIRRATCGPITASETANPPVTMPAEP